MTLDDYFNTCSLGMVEYYRSNMGKDMRNGADPGITYRLIKQMNAVIDAKRMSVVNKKSGQCKMPLFAKKPDIHICILDLGHEGLHHTYGVDDIYFTSKGR